MPLGHWLAKKKGEEVERARREKQTEIEEALRAQGLQSTAGHDHVAAAVTAGEPFRVAFDVELDGHAGGSGGDGVFVVEVHPEWAPIGAARIKELVECKFYDDTYFFRVIPGFMAQFGLSGDPATSQQWRGACLPDDPVLASNSRGRVSFATSGPVTGS